MAGGGLATEPPDAAGAAGEDLEAVFARGRGSRRRRDCRGKDRCPGFLGGSRRWRGVKIVSGQSQGQPPRLPRPSREPSQLVSAFSYNLISCSLCLATAPSFIRFDSRRTRNIHRLRPSRFSPAAGRAGRGLLWCRAVESILAKALGQDASQLAAAEKRDLLARLLGRLAHEVRNPLSSLDIHVQLLEEDLASLAPQMREQLTLPPGDHPRRIAPAGRHRGALPAAGRAGGGGPGAGRNRARSSRTCASCCGPRRRRARSKSPRRVDGSLPRVMADPVRLTQALLNVVINAIQAVEKKGRVEVSGGCGRRAGMRGRERQRAGHSAGEAGVHL